MITDEHHRAEVNRLLDDQIEMLFAQMRFWRYTREEIYQEFGGNLPWGEIDRLLAVEGGVP